MASATRELSLLLTLDDRVSGNLKGLQGRLEGMRPTFNRMAGYGTAAFAGISAGIGMAVDKAGRAQDIENLFDIAFSNTEDRMNKFVTEFSNEFGRAETSIRQMAQNIGFSIQMGTELGEEASADMAQEQIKVAEALAFTYDHVRDGEQAMNAITEAFNGNAETLRRLVPTIREANIEEKALEMGLADTKEEVDRNIRAQALHQLILEGTRGSEEALENSEGTYADTKQRLRSSIQDATEALGSEFLPMVTRLLQAIVPIVERTGEWIEQNPELTKAIVILTGGVAGLVAVLGTLGILIASITPAIAAIGAPVILVTSAVMGLAAAGWYMYSNWEQVKTGLGLLWDTIKNLFRQGVEFVMDNLYILLPGGLAAKAIMDNWGSISDFFRETWETIVGIFEWAGDKIMGILNPIIDTAKRAIDLARRARDAAGGAISGARDRIGGAIDRITPFANGGIVNQPTLGMVGEAGPVAVIPLNKAGSFGGVNVTITGDTFMGEDDMAEKVGDKIVKILKHNNKL